MYESLIANMKTRVQPMIDVAETNRKTLEQLSSLQTSCMAECLYAGLDQLAALSEVKDPQAGAELQTQFFKDLEIKLTDTAAQEFNVVREAQKSITAAVNRSYTMMTDISFLEELDQELTKAPPKRK